MKSTTLFKIIALGALLLAALTAVGFLLWPEGEDLQPPELRNALFPQPRELGDFALTASDGAPFGPQRLRNHWTLLFFGYTRCPDICPTTLLTMQQFRKELEPHPSALADTQFVFVSVDPKRDTPEHLKLYLSYFDKSFLGATGERESIDHLVDTAGAVYMFDGDTSGENYIVNHSATIYLVDPKGRLFGRLTPPHDSAEMADTYLKVRRYYGDLSGL